MVDVTMRMTFTGVPLEERTFEAHVHLCGERTVDGDQRLWEYVRQEVTKQAAFAEYYEQLPDITDFHASVTQTFSLNEFTSSSFFDRKNTLEVWFEIAKAVTTAKYKCAESRAYKRLEPSLLSTDPEKERAYHLHLQKMDCFKLATYSLAKIEDLLLRLVFENLGASLITVDLGRPHWERVVLWDKVMDGLKKQRETNPHLQAVSDSDYNELMRILRDFRNPQFVGEFVRYRDRMTHGFTPSVDYPELYFRPQDRVGTPIVDSRGNKGTSWPISSRPAMADYSYLDLYDITTKTLDHWLGLLRQLRAIARFSPEAVR